MKRAIKSLINQLKLYPWKQQSYSFHAYIIQALIFLYSIYRYSSRSYESYGFLPEDSFSYPRWWTSSQYPLPLSHFSTFQFIYKFIPHINDSQITSFQYILVFFSFLGLIGFLPRISGLISFLLAIHLEGILISADAEISGGTILFISLFIISISPKDALYHIGKFKPINHKSNDASFLIFAFSLVVGIWYFSGGINKIVDCGIEWPFNLKINLLAETVHEKQFLFNQRISFPSFTVTQFSPILSIFSGIFTLLGELASLLLITKFRYKYIIIFFLISMHTSVYFLAGINFTGNTILLFGILNWNSLIEKEVVIFDDKCNFCLNCINFIKKYIKPINLKYVQLSKVKDSKFDFKKYGLREDLSTRRAHKAIGLVSETDLMYGYNTIANLLIRSPFFFFGLLMYLPPVNFLGIVIYKFISDNRYLISGNCDSGNCKI